MPKSFVDHLLAACHKPINMPLFLEGYAQVREGVARPGRFLLHGLTIDAPAGVYSPHETSSTRFLMDHFGALGLDAPTEGKEFLEVGCGAGAISILAARNGWKVFAGDIDDAAVTATRANAVTNGVTLDARQSDLFSAFEGQRFDVVLFNQPFFHVERPIEEDERTLSDFGGQLYARFMEEARRFLKPGGYVVIAYSNCSNVEILNQPGWNLELRSFDFDAATDYIRAHFKATPA